MRSLITASGALVLAISAPAQAQDGTAPDEATIADFEERTEQPCQQAKISLLYYLINTL